MDRDEFGANTDVLVVVDSARETLLWVPRDLWCEGIRDRVNTAFALGGHDRLCAALAEHGIGIEHSICLLPAALRAGMEGVTVQMPVHERLEFWYPLEPWRPIEAGRKRIAFEPPYEALSGERIDQWIGARFEVDGSGSDLDRIRRQQELVGVLLRAKFDFGRFVKRGLPVRISGPEAIEEASRVKPSWRLVRVGGITMTTIDGKSVLTRRASSAPARPDREGRSPG